MKRIIFLLIVTAALTACATDGKPVTTSPFISAACGGTVSNYTRTKVTYGKNGIVTKPLSTVRPNSEFRIKLIPKPKKKWEDKLVSAKGDTAKSDANADWINGSGRAKDLTGSWFVAGCVPDVPDKTTYKFDIEVEGLPVLDPRVEVRN